MKKTLLRAIVIGWLTLVTANCEHITTLSSPYKRCVYVWLYLIYKYTYKFDVKDPYYATSNPSWPIRLCRDGYRDEISSSSRLRNKPIYISYTHCSSSVTTMIMILLYFYLVAYFLVNGINIKSFPLGMLICWPRKIIFG